MFHLKHFWEMIIFSPFSLNNYLDIQPIVRDQISQVIIYTMKRK